MTNLTHFVWMRFYLISAVLLSFVLPLVNIPQNSASPIFYMVSRTSEIINTPVFNFTEDFNVRANHTFNGKEIGYNILTTIYLVGILYGLITFLRNLYNIGYRVKSNNKYKDGKYTFIEVDNKLPAFSFFNFIFINRDLKKLNPNEFKQIVDHEIAHAKQLHSADIILVELVSILTWFNPSNIYLRNKLQELHEYLADESIKAQHGDKKEYAQLLLSLATEHRQNSLLASFSGKQIARRIQMLNKKRSLLRHKLLFLVTIPISGLLLTSFVVLKNDGTKAVPLPSNRLSHTKGQLNNKKTIGEIFWEGNFLFTSAELSRFLGMNKGDKYKKENLHNRVWEDMDGIATFYFDRGYMFFNAEFIEMPVNNDIMDLRIIITEGMPVKVRNIIINGNKKVRDEDIRAKIQLLPDELFSKTKIIQSLEAIKEMEAFDDNIEVTPIPITDEAISTYSITDVVFELTEK